MSLSRFIALLSRSTIANKLLTSRRSKILNAAEQRLLNQQDQFGMLRIAFVFDDYDFVEFPDVLYSLMATTDDKYIIGYLVGLDRDQMPGADSIHDYVIYLNQIMDATMIHPLLRLFMYHIGVVNLSRVDQCSMIDTINAVDQHFVEAILTSPASLWLRDELLCQPPEPEPFLNSVRSA